MNPTAIYSKTGKGVQEASGKTSNLSRADRAVLAQIDGKTTVEELQRKFDKTPMDKLEALILQMDKEGYVREVSPGVAQAPPPGARTGTSAKSGTYPKIPTPPPPKEEAEELDFTKSVKHPPKPPVDLAAQARAEAERRAKEKAETDFRARQEAEKARQEAEAKARAEAAARARAEAEAKAKADADAKIKAAREAAVRAAAEAKAKAEAEAKARAEAAERERKAAEERARKESEEKAKLEVKLAEERKAREAAERKAEAERKAREEAERKAKEEAERKAKEEAERKAKEEAERKAKEEADRKANTGAERARREAEDLRRQLEAESKEDEGTKRKAREDKEAEERRRKYEAERRAQEEARRKREEEEARAAAAKAAEEKASSMEDVLLADLDSFSKREEEERQEKESAARKEKEETARRAREQGERAERERAEANRRKDEEQRRRKDEERRAREEAERSERESAERRKREEEERKRRAKELFAARTAVRHAEEEEEDIGVTEEDLGLDEVKREKPAVTARKREQEREEPEEPAAPAAPARRRRRVKLGKPIAIGIVVLLVAAVVGVNFMPLPTADYERAASQALGQPVRIGAARRSVLTGVELKFERVTIGGAARIGLVRAQAGLGAAFGNPMEFDRIELEGLVIAQPQLGSALFGALKRGELSVSRIAFRQARFEGPLGLPAFDGEAQLAADGSLRAVKLSGLDNFSARLSQQGGTITFEASGSSVSIPFVPGLTLSDFAMKGSATREAMNVTSFDGRIFEGVLAGTAQIRWGADWRIEGDLEARGMNAGVFAPALVSEGRLAGRGKYSLSGTVPGRLAPRLDGTFKIERGVLGSFDLGRAIQTQGAQAAGRTQFSELNAEGRYEQGNVQLRNVTIAAGALNAGASLDVGADGVLAGRVIADVKAPAKTLSATLNLGGKLRQPELRK